MREPKNKTSFFAPSYYPRFRCIADRCRHSCCVDWEICIDERTLSKYRSMEHIPETVTECADGACFALGADGRCPHLDEHGLCRIILDHGEDYLSDICRNHPRFFNRVGGGRVEVGLGLVCEEACRLILTEDVPLSLIPIEAIPDEGLSFAGGGEEENEVTDFDPLPLRDRIMAQIRAPGGSFAEKRAAIEAAFGLSEIHTMAEWMEQFLSLEILDTAWKRLLQDAQDAPLPPSSMSLDPFDPCYERLLAYFVYRHVSVAWSADNLLARLGFSILSVEMIRCLFERGGDHSPEALIDLSRRYSAEIEYSEENTAALIFEFECGL